MAVGLGAALEKSPVSDCLKRNVVQRLTSHFFRLFQTQRLESTSYMLLARSAPCVCHFPAAIPASRVHKRCPAPVHLPSTLTSTSTLYALERDRLSPARKLDIVSVPSRPLPIERQGPRKCGEYQFLWPRCVHQMELHQRAMRWRGEGTGA